MIGALHFIRTGTLSHEKLSSNFWPDSLKLCETNLSICDIEYAVIGAEKIDS